MEKTIEQQVADAILERDVATLKIGGVTYRVAPPSIATLILVSEAVSTLPSFEYAESDDVAKNQERIFSAIIHNARHYRALGDIAAILILGAKGLTEDVEVCEEKPYLFGLLRRKTITRKTIDRKAELSKIILENLSSGALFDLLINRIKTLDLTSFFSITTSLNEANVLKPTREVEN